VAGCCSTRDCARLFNRRFARRAANRYRRRGLDRTAARMTAFLRERGLAEASVLEIGGGVGEIGLELVKAGASRAVNLELSPAYEREAAALASEAGLAGRVEWRIHDIAEAPDAVAPADVVVMHRVVCCYPDYERLLGVAAGHARRALVYSYPPRNVASRAYITAVNLVLRLSRSTFRAFTHPPAEMAASIERHGLRQVYEAHAPIWQVAGHERRA
jgi:magnesium-protoporphyrin O-methyltransferase